MIFLDLQYSEPATGKPWPLECIVYRHENLRELLAHVKQGTPQGDITPGSEELIDRIIAVSCDRIRAQVIIITVPQQKLELLGHDSPI